MKVILLGDLAKEHITFLTWFSPMSAPSPIFPLPALFAIIVRSLHFVSIKPCINSTGLPASPNPPNIITAPSKTSDITSFTELKSLFIFIDSLLLYL